MIRRPPGLLRPSDQPEVVMMICTAGHVDHGKTRLVKLLTGCNTDRLKEEQERGLTIELGFAPCLLGGALCIGIVDVPGHEKFVRNMVAGVSGIAMTVLVVAADDGVMPQTVEHVRIMELLGVRRGMIALTKTDLVEPETVAARVEELRRFTEDTFLRGAPICPLSSETGDGLFAFYETLEAEVKRLAAARTPGIFRMPVERTFVQKGFGVVTTGIPVAGSIQPGTPVELTPGGQRGRIRAMQRFLRDAAEGGQGQCLALNIPEFGKLRPERGQVVSLPGYLRPASCVHLRIHTVPGLDPPLRHGEQIRFHTGTSGEPGTIYLLDEKTLGGNAEGNATVVLAEPIAAAAHDRFIVRRLSPATTLAGGEIVAVAEDAKRPRKADALELFRKFDAVFGADRDSLEARLEFCLWTKHPTGATLPEIAQAALLPEDTTTVLLAHLTGRNVAMPLDGGAYIHQENYQAAYTATETAVRAAQETGEALSLDLNAFRDVFHWPEALWRKLLADLETAGAVKARGRKILLRDGVEGLHGEDRRIAEAIETLYTQTGFQSPRPDELPDLVNAAPDQVKRLLDHLCNNGALIRLGKNVVLCYTSMRQAQDAILREIETRGALDSAEFKYRIDSTRKYALAILDYFDARGVTLRHGNERKLTSRYRDRMI